jgi:hypothetical protein
VQLCSGLLVRYEHLSAHLNFSCARTLSRLRSDFDHSSNVCFCIGIDCLAWSAALDCEHPVLGVGTLRWLVETDGSFMHFRSLAWLYCHQVGVVSVGGMVLVDPCGVQLRVPNFV